MSAGETDTQHVTMRQFRIWTGRYFETALSHVHDLDLRLLLCLQHRLLAQSNRRIKQKHQSHIDQTKVSKR